MHPKLEDILREKERELKLHEKFLGLARLCDAEVFPRSSAPLRAHVESLKRLVELLVPAPNDRRSEMFSGELFILLCVLYLHDTGAANWYGWSGAGEILRAMDARSRALFLNAEIAGRLGFPMKAMELVDSLIFSVKKIPMEWEITDGASKAIIRNGPMLGAIFDFAHLLWDICTADSGHSALKREQTHDLRPPCATALAVDSREGIISVTCKPRGPYQVHVLDRVKEHVETRFNRFRDAVNGRLGFQYKQIVWDIADCADPRRPPGQPGYAITPFQGVPYLRSEEASRLLDKLFRYRHVIVVGDFSAGKTTMITSFAVPQLRFVSPNVFYAEIWDRPVHEIREAIAKAGFIPPGATVDIISICKKLLKGGPCFFIIDGAERLKTVNPDEWEKLERFVGFCLEHENAYLAVLGDREEFFSWYKPFRSMSLSAVFEAGSIEHIAALSLPWEALPREVVNEKAEEALRAAPDRNELREIVSVLAGSGAKTTLSRYNPEDIRFETLIPIERISSCLDLLQEKGIVRRHEASGGAFWALSSRQLMAPLRQCLGLDEFAGKREVREELRRAGEEGSFLDPERLDVIEDLQAGMMFTKKETGLILGSMVLHGKDWALFLEKAEREVRGFDGEPILPLLEREQPEVRMGALRLLVRARDDALINPLLAHLRKETAPELRAFLVEGLVGAGKRKTVVALMGALAEMEDRDERIKAIDSISRLPARNAVNLLLEIANAEKDPEMIDRIDYWLYKLEE
jgi:hypothetical protein